MKKIEGLMKIFMIAICEDWLLSDMTTRANILYIYKHVTCFLVNFKLPLEKKGMELFSNYML